MICKLDYLGGIPEIVLFNSCVNWARQNNQTLKGEELYKKLKNIIPEIRFPLMKLDEFSKDVHESEIFIGKTEQSVDILTYLSRPENRKPETKFRKDKRLASKPTGDVKVIEQKPSADEKNKNPNIVKDLINDGDNDSIWKFSN